ncbi:hypothetical protein [Streptomyces sp. NPDC050704]|uniref:hypothetical protein n=1 Tax=Streptomyces sp. NPDC050704 TaxID=3157219 RepID=UPI00342C933E
MGRVRGGRLLARAGVAVLLGVATVACGQTDAGAGEADAPRSAGPSPSPSHGRFEEEIELADGRRVGMYYAAGRGLMEQHQNSKNGAWSKPHLVYGTKSNACQSLTLKAFGGTVAAIADWGYYCADGEPPTESVAAVGTRDLSTWDAKLTKNFDGWEKVATVGDTEHLRFTRSSTEWLTRLAWSRADGFAAVENIRR